MINFTHPKALWVISFVKIWDTFSYFGTQTILALYFMHIFHLERSISYILYGAYAAIAFSSPVLGGIIADKWFGSKKTLCVGLLLNIVGNLIMVSLTHYSFCLGLATSLIGSGLYKSNSIHLVGNIYSEESAHKESGFTWFYLSMNLGGTLGPLAYGVVAHFFGWNYTFLLSAFGLILGGTWFFANRHLFVLKGPAVALNRVTECLIFILIIFLIWIISLVFCYPQFANFFICTVFTFALCYILFAIKHYQSKKRMKLIAIMIISFIAMFYFAGGLQTGTTVTLFVQKEIEKGNISFNLPSSTLNALYCLFVIVLAPLVSLIWDFLGKKGIYFSAPAKISFGILLASFGIMIFSLSALTHSVLFGVVIGYSFLSAGELILSPAAYTAISNFSPTGMKSSMMGCWLLFIAIGGYFSSVLANISHKIAFDIQEKGNMYFHTFFIIAIFMLFIAISSMLCVSKIKKMML